jgi:RecA DNA recombination protein
MTARAHLESLLRAKKLDVTLTGGSLWDPTARRIAPDDLAPLHAVDTVDSISVALGGGLRRGHLSEIVGGRSSGRTGVVYRALAAAVSRGELAALIDTHDRFDPESAVAAGLDLSRLLWVRETGDTGRALKAMNLVLQAGGFGLVVWDLVDAPARASRALPFTTWFRLSRIVEGSQTAVLIVAAEHLARSSGGATIVMEPAKGSRAIWTGAQSNRARLLQGLDVRPRVMSFGAIR